VSCSYDQSPPAGAKRAAQPVGWVCIGATPMAGPATLQLRSLHEPRIGPPVRGDAVRSHTK